MNSSNKFLELILNEMYHNQLGDLILRSMSWPKAAHCLARTKLSFYIYFLE